MSKRVGDTQSHGHDHRLPSLTNADDIDALAIGRQSSAGERRARILRAIADYYRRQRTEAGK